jgi:hypothetical protein
MISALSLRCVEGEKDELFELMDYQGLLIVADILSTTIGIRKPSIAQPDGKLGTKFVRNRQFGLQIGQHWDSDRVRKDS